MKSHRRTQPTPGERDEHRTPFTPILERLLELEPAIIAAALVDGEGEAVDYAGALKPFYTKVVAAHLRIVLEELASITRLEAKGAALFGGPRQLLVRGTRRSFLARRLPEGYALVLVLKRHGFGISPRALTISERDLAKEAGWPEPSAKGPAWHPVRVETSWRNRRRPLRMLAGDHWEHLEVLGSLVGLGRERGYRCRLKSGVEVTLVREPAGAWYTDEPVDELIGGGHFG